MKKQWLAGPFLLSLCVLAYGQDGASNDLKKMQGKWTPTALYILQERVPDDLLPAFAMTFKEGIMAIETGPFTYAKVEFRLDPSKTPKAYEHVIPNGPDKGTIIPGIYELDGDTLKISMADFGEPRPKDYSMPKGKSGRIVMILRRAK